MKSKGLRTMHMIFASRERKELKIPRKTRLMREKYTIEPAKAQAQI